MTVVFAGIKRPEIVVDFECPRRCNGCFPSNPFKDCLTAKMLKAGVNSLPRKTLEQLPNNRVFLVKFLECPRVFRLGGKTDFKLCNHVKIKKPMIAIVEMVNPHQIAVHFQHVGYAGSGFRCAVYITAEAFSDAANIAAQLSVFGCFIFVHKFIQCRLRQSVIPTKFHCIQSTVTDITPDGFWFDAKKLGGIFDF